MALHICFLGIDGSGKSTVADALPDLLAGWEGLRVASAGESFRVVDPEQTLLAPRFEPRRLPLTARLARWLKKAARRNTNSLRLYPVLKVAHMALQDAAARRLERRYRPDVVVSDGNLVLSTAGRAVNYLHSARQGESGRPWTVDAGWLRDALAGLDEAGTPAGSSLVRRLRKVRRVLRWVGLDILWLPDVVVLLDLTPAAALERIRRRGRPCDAHENPSDMARARQMYLRTLEALTVCRRAPALVCVPVADLSPGEVARRVVEALRSHGIPAATDAPAVADTLGTVGSRGTSWLSFVKPGYFLRCLTGCWRDGAWREPQFALSRMGRRFVREGYSAEVMQSLYDQDRCPARGMDRVFAEYPLHRAVYDRLHALVPAIGAQVLSRNGSLRLFTAPSGMGEDVCRALSQVAGVRPGGLQGIRVTAVDLDPHRTLGPHWLDQEDRLGLEVEFHRGDLAAPGRWRGVSCAPFDIALFVGLSSWLPKPILLRHLGWLREHMKEDGVLLTDVFTPGAYALSGWYGGYRAHYYTPETFRALLDACWFDGMGATVTSGRDGLNHVLVCRPNAQEPAKGFEKDLAVRVAVARRALALA